MRFFGVLFLMGLLLLSSRVALAGKGGPSLDTLVQSAKTPADHAAIAARYDALAEQSQASADMHTKMLASYTEAPGRWPHHYKMTEHCTTLINSYKVQVMQYRWLAQTHRAIGEDLKASPSSSH